MRAEKAIGAISGKFGSIVAQIIAKGQFDRDAFNNWPRRARICKGSTAIPSTQRTTPRYGAPIRGAVAIGQPGISFRRVPLRPTEG